MKISHKKMLSFLLVFAMLVALFPAAALAGSPPAGTASAAYDEGNNVFAPISLSAGTVSAAAYDEAITSFAPLTLFAGTVSGAIYADADAVIVALSEQFPNVTAQTPGGTVSVPVTGWADTDSYDPATAGSYTFSAALGDIPAGYANPDNLTAAAEVVVSAEGALEPGVYSVPLTFYNGQMNYEVKKNFTSADQRIQFKDRALVTVNADNSCTVKFKIESYSLADFIQIVRPELVDEVKEAYNPFSGLRPGTFNCPEAYVQALLDRGWDIEPVDETNGYYLQDGVTIEQPEEDKALDTGYVTLTVENQAVLENDLLMKTYSYLYGDAVGMPKHMIVHFAVEEAVRLPETLTYTSDTLPLAGLGFSWSDCAAGTIQNAARNSSQAGLFLDGLFEQSVEVTIGDDGRLLATFTFKEGQRELLASIEVAQSREIPESKEDYLRYSWLLNEFCNTAFVEEDPATDTNTKLSESDGTITVGFDDLAWGRLLRVQTKEHAAYNAGLEGDTYKEFKEQYYYGSLRLEPEIGEEDAERVWVSNGVSLIGSKQSLPEDAVFTAVIDNENPGAFSQASFNMVKNFAQDEDHFVHYELSLTSGGQPIAPDYPVTVNIPIPDGYDLETLSASRITGTGSLEFDGSMSTFCEIDPEKRTIMIRTSVREALNTGYIFYDRGRAMDITTLADGVYRVKVTTAHSAYPEQPSMSNAALENNTGYLKVTGDSRQLYLDTQPVEIGSQLGYLSDVYYYQAGEEIKKSTVLEYMAKDAQQSASAWAAGNLLMDDIAETYHLHYPKRVVLPLPDSQTDNMYMLRFIVPIMDGLKGAVPGSGAAAANALLRITSATKLEGAELAEIENAKYHYSKTVLHAKIDEAVWHSETLEAGAVKSILEAAIAEAKETYRGDLDTDAKILAAVSKLDAAIRVAGGGEEVDLSALEAKLTEARAIPANRYTTESFAALTAAIAAAQEVYDNTEATQAEVDAQVTALETAIDALVVSGLSDGLYHIPIIFGSKPVGALDETNTAYFKSAQLLVAGENMTILMEMQKDSAGTYVYAITSGAIKAEIFESDGDVPVKFSLTVPYTENKKTAVLGKKTAEGGTATANGFIVLDFANATPAAVSRLEAPAISSAYDEQNSSYTVTISTATTGAVKYSLSGSESGTGEWLDYAGPFVVDSTNELINQGILYVLAYVASTETGVADSETTLALLDFRGGSEPGPIEDGAYTLPVSLWHAANDQPSMGNNALEQTARLVVADGQGALQLTFKPLTFMGMTGYLSQLDLLDNIVFNENNYPVSYDLIPATVISTHDVVDEFNHPDSTDPNCAGKPYPRDLSIPVVLGQEYTWVHVYVPVMGSLGSGDQVARIKLDWSNLVQVPEEENPVYTLTPAADEAYQAGTTPDGILTMTVNEGFSGLKYFGVQVTPVREHGGKEAVVFTHQRDEGAQLSLNVTKADFDAVPEAQAGFNVLAGDEIAVYIVDDLTNDPDTNPIILQ